MDNNILLGLLVLVLVVNLIVSGLTLSKLNKSKDGYVSPKANTIEMLRERERLRQESLRQESLRQESLRQAQANTNIISSSDIIYNPSNIRV